MRQEDDRRLAAPAQPSQLDIRGTFLANLQKPTRVTDSTLNRLAAATRNKIRSWSALWGVLDLADTVEVRFSERMRAPLGRCRPAQGRVALGVRLRDDAPDRRAR
jgi:hypothetical protein